MLQVFIDRYNVYTGTTLTHSNKPGNVAVKVFPSPVRISGYFRHEARSPPLIDMVGYSPKTRFAASRTTAKASAIIGLTFHLVENDREIHPVFRAIVRQIKRPFRPHEIQLVKQYGQDVLILSIILRLIF